MPGFDIAQRFRINVMPGLTGHPEKQMTGGQVLQGKQPCVYILASKRNGTLYIGVTSNLARRMYQHKNHFVAGFTKRYGIEMLVWYEIHATMESAIMREKQLKKWNRSWKIRLIESENRHWEDLYQRIL
jgi:putative endonuclease